MSALHCNRRYNIKQDLDYTPPATRYTAPIRCNPMIETTQLGQSHLRHNPKAQAQHETAQNNPCTTGRRPTTRAQLTTSSQQWVNTYRTVRRRQNIVTIAYPRRTPIDKPHKSTQWITQTRIPLLIHTVHYEHYTRYTHTHTKPQMCNVIITIFYTNFITLYILIQIEL